MADEFNSFGSGLDLFRYMTKIALDGQKLNSGDFFDDEGLLRCGVCKERRQTFYPYQVNPDNPKETVPVKVTALCRCDREKEEKLSIDKKRLAQTKQIEKLKSLSLMDEKFKSVSFETLQITQYNQRNLRLCKRFATGFDEMLEKNQGLLLWGDVGTGKSYAAAAITNYLLDRCVSTIMTSFVKIVEDIQSNRVNESVLMDMLSEAKLVVFDDLGAERKTDYAIEKVYNSIDTRYRRKLPMILTTNLTLEEMQRETDIRYSRIYDRIFETCYPMQFTGPSWRKKNAYKMFNDMEAFLSDDES